MLQPGKFLRTVWTSRGLPNTYAYEPTNGDTIDDVIASGYFYESIFTSDDGFDGGIIECTVGSSFYRLRISGSSASIINSGISNTEAAGVVVESIESLALEPKDTGAVYLLDGVNSGWFYSTSSSIIDGVYADVDRYFFVPASTDSSGASGGWVRSSSQLVSYTPSETKEIQSLIGEKIGRYIELNGVTLNTSGESRFNSNAVIAFARFYNSSGVVLSQSDGDSNILILASEIEAGATSNATAVNINSGSAENIKVIGTNITANGFAFLTNEGADVDGVILSSNNINSGSDAIEINAPLGAIHKNMTIGLNTLRSVSEDSGTSGFAVGIAAGKNIAVVGNASSASSGEAYHVEDSQETLTFVGNTAQECDEEGFFCIESADSDGDGLPVVANSFKASASSTSSGIMHGWTGYGSIKGMAFVANRINNFTTGLEMGKGWSIAAYNSIKSPGIAIKSLGHGSVIGVNFVQDCSGTLIYGDGRNMVGGVIADTIPTTILDVSSVSSSQMGSMIRELHIPCSLTATSAAATSEIPVLELPTIMNGRVIYRFASSGGYLYISFNAHWDGTTLTTDGVISDHQGDFSSSIAISESGGYINLSVYTSTAMTPYMADVTFSGEYYKNNA